MCHFFESVGVNVSNLVTVGVRIEMGAIGGSAVSACLTTCFSTDIGASGGRRYFEY